MAMNWSRCPTWWIMDKKLKELVGNKQPGNSLAALKCLVAISVCIDFNTCKSKLSYSDFEVLTGLSRPKVSIGITKLADLKIVLIDKSKYVNEYQLTLGSADGEEKGWTKLPVDRLRINLPEVSNRGIAPLAALKIYLTLAAVRPNNSESINISYETLTKYTGLQRKHIRKGLSVLYSSGLVDAEPPGDSHNSNAYKLLGLSIKN